MSQRAAQTEWSPPLTLDRGRSINQPTFMPRSEPPECLRSHGELSTPCGLLLQDVADYLKTTYMGPEEIPIYVCWRLSIYNIRKLPEIFGFSGVHNEVLYMILGSLSASMLFGRLPGQIVEASVSDDA